MAISYKQIDIFSDLIALDLGIIHPTVAMALQEEKPKSIDEALSSMTTEESRRAKRKFRKLARNASRHRSSRRSARRKRSDVMLAIRMKAWNLVKSTSADSGDNDEV